MFGCYICGCQLSNIAIVRSHLQNHFILGELSFPIKCKQPHCKSSFRTIFNFVRHLRSFHHNNDETPYESVTELPCSSDSSVVGECDDDVILPPIHGDRQRQCLRQLQLEGAALVAALRANSSIPYSVIPNIVTSVNSMLDMTVDSCVGEMLSLVEKAGVSRDTLSSVSASLKQHSDTLSQPLSFLASRYKQDSYFEAHPMAVTPQTVTLGLRLETSEGITRTVYDTYQYVSIEATLRSLLMNRDYVNLLIDDRCKPGLISDCRDGFLYKHHPLLNDASKCSIAIELYYDGMGTTNPLRGQSAMYNVGVFYFVIKNLPNIVNSCFSNVHLVAMCYCPDLKMYGFDAILSRFVSEMIQLSTVGFDGTFPVLGTRTVYVSLLQVAGDNLALNGMLGFIESFSVDYFCTICYCTQEDIQHKFHENEFELRSVGKYNADVDQKCGLSCRGVKRKCVLNDIPHFHATNNFSLDIMHTILEGIVPVELSCVLFYLCREHRSVSLLDISKRVDRFWGVINVDKCNKLPS